MSKQFKKITITSNGNFSLVLENATITEERREYCKGHPFMEQIVTGTVVGGGVTNRLFQHTSHKPHKVGERRSYEIGRRQICGPDDNAYVDCTSV